MFANACVPDKLLGLVEMVTDITDSRKAMYAESAHEKGSLDLLKRGAAAGRTDAEETVPYFAKFCSVWWTFSSS